MDLDYSVKDSLFISKEKWGKYFDAMFIDSDNVQRPFQIYFELVPRGFTNKVCNYIYYFYSKYIQIYVKNLYFWIAQHI